MLYRVLLAVLLAVGLVACTGEDDEEIGELPPVPTTEYEIQPGEAGVGSNSDTGDEGAMRFDTLDDVEEDLEDDGELEEVILDPGEVGEPGDLEVTEDVPHEEVDAEGLQPQQEAELGENP